MLNSVLLLGFVIGLQHAFEADHLAAVSSLVGRRHSEGDRVQPFRRLGPSHPPLSMAQLGLIWGTGHTLALFSIGVVVLFLPYSLPANFESLAETAVGLVLVILGGHLLFRLWRERVHVHVHQHEGGELHLHAHSHRGESRPHSESEHQHQHGLHWQTLAVGLMHGFAGSAALVVYVSATLETPLLGLLYIGVFGIGSMVGMAALSTVIALPLRLTAGSLGRRLTWAHGTLQVLIALGTIGIGVRLLVRFASASG